MTIQTMPVAEIEISSVRQRRQFDEMKHVELCDSIQNEKIGLMHPVVLRIGTNGKPTLVAGERRLRAFKDSHELGVSVFHAGERVPPGHVPYTMIGEMDPLDAWEAELEENIRRVDLTWQEKASATEELLKLRTKQAEAKGLPAPTTRSIAEEIIGGAASNSFHTNTRDELMAARFLQDPEVKGAGSLKEAVKVIKRKEEKQKHDKLAAAIGPNFSGANHTLVNSNSEDWMAGNVEESFDVILTDPPYGMGADEFGDSGGMAPVEGHGYQDNADTLWKILEWFPAESFRVAKKEAHLYLFCDVDWFLVWKGKLSLAGWKVFRTPLIWHKQQGFRAPWPEHGPQRKYEMILYAIKGDRKTRKLAADVLTFAGEENLGHAAQKPVTLYHELLSRSIMPGDKVLDPFCGTGPIFPAAHLLKCFATGIEMDKSSYGIAAKRIQGLK